MTDEKWENLLEMIKQQFQVLDKGVEDLVDTKGVREFIIFYGPLGKMKLERTSKPRVIDKKVYSSRRIGAAVREELVYSKTELIHQFEAYHWDEKQNDWLKIKAGDNFRIS